VAVQGLTNDRRHQFGRQGSFGTAVAAKRAFLFSGVPNPDPGWTDREADMGSIDLVAAPLRGPGNLTAPLTSDGVAYNDLPALFSAIFGGNVSSTGAGDAQTYSWAPASATVDTVDVYTYEFGDDVTTDWMQLSDGILESLEFSGPSGLGPFTASMAWRFGHFGGSGLTDLPDSPAVPTTLDLELNPAIWYLKDTGIYIASDPDDLDSSQITDALHSCTLRIGGDVDQKRWANGDQSFDIDAYSRAKRTIELECVYSKTSDTVGTGSETDALYSDTPVTRYVQLKSESKELLETGPDVPYSVTLAMPMRYYTRVEGADGGNSTVTLMGRAFYDAVDFDGVFTAEVVCGIDSSTDL
jgi:hypothetical protein